MEHKLIRWLRSQNRNSRIPIGCGIDDAAFVNLPSKQIVVSSDMLVEGTHFKVKEKPKNIGRKSAAVSLSDIAAMGAKPLYMVVSLGIPQNYSFSSVKSIFNGMSSVLIPFKTKIIGGDTVRSPSIIIDSTIIGTKCGNILKRKGACIGDLVFTTGFFGNSFTTGWHHSFKPRIREMQLLKRKIKITSSMDASDGLYASLRILSEESSVCFEIDTSSIRFRKRQNSFEKSLESALFDGEDFEMVFTGSCEKPEKIIKEFKKRFGIPLSIIGKVNKGKGLKFFDQNNKKIHVINREFKHFE
ncbi:MAG: thiamine-monophosphate kinase [Candidatus Aureabacteria bacterium]|nr:thiamine-monophosphate kinase [Candidatus Auribacterota bacterium]